LKQEVQGKRMARFIFLLFKVLNHSHKESKNRTQKLSAYAFVQMALLKSSGTGRKLHTPEMGIFDGSSGFCVGPLVSNRPSDCL
jgi:hypothetical protein